MTLTTLEGIPPEIAATMSTRLDAIAAGHGVAKPFAVESGSRAWGFPSPDSDFDCRFVFVRPVAQRLSLWQRRDVIELPLDKIYDVNGWELGKALKLLLKGNAVIVEWLTSPLTYRCDSSFRNPLLAFAKRYARRDLIGRHYLHLGERQQKEHLGGADAPQKKLFYALRPAAALRWLRMHERQAVAPMHFPTLMAECDPPPAVAAIVADLIARKAATRELGSAPIPEPLFAFVDSEFVAARKEFASTRTDVGEHERAEADRFYLAMTSQFSAASL